MDGAGTLPLRDVAAMEFASRSPSRAVLLMLWILAGVAMLVGLGRAPAQRTQEARVLETAREMLGRPSHDWLVPRLNGEVRLKKPPLAYWMAAVAFTIGGVSEAVGRVPTAVLGWLTLGLVYSCGAWAFGRSAGMLASAALLGSYMFFRHFRLAETDAPATLFVTLGIVGLWRGSESTGRGLGLWYHLSALGIALAAMAKGPPAAFVFVFFIAFVVVMKRWRMPVDWVLSGAPLTLLVIALPWWVHVNASPEAQQIGQELRVVTSGETHPAPLWQYFPQLLLAAAPWSGFLGLAVAHAIARWKDEPRPRVLLIWMASIFLPLCLIGNKQQHYLLPLMPPAMLLVGWVMDRAIRGQDASLRRAATFVLLATAVVMGVGGLGLALAGRLQGIGIQSLDLISGVMIIATAAGVIWMARRDSINGYWGLAVSAAVLVPLLLAFWLPGRFERDPRVAAVKLRQRFGDGPYCFWGPNVSLPLCFAMRLTIPQVDNQQDLAQRAREQPGLVVIAQTKNNLPPPPLPNGYSPALVVVISGQKFEVYRTR